MMKKMFLVLSLLLFTLPGFSSSLPMPSSSGEPIDRVVAVVNDNVITQSQVNRVYRRTLKQIKAHGANMPSKSILKSEILNHLIYQNLQLQLAKRGHLTVTEAQVNRAIDNIAKQHRISVVELKSKVQKDGYTYLGFRKEIKQQLLISMLQHQVLAEKIKVTDSEINQFLNKTKLQSKFSPRYHLIDVLVPLPASPTTTQAKQAKVRALSIMKSLRQGASIHSVKGAEVDDLGWKTFQGLPDLFIHQLEKMRPGDIAGPLRAQNGYHVIKLIDMKKAQTPLPTRKRVTILIKEQKFQKAVQKWLNKLRKQAYIKILHPQ